MNDYGKEAVAGLLGGLITSATAIGTALQETPLVEMSGGQWMMIGMGGFVAAASTWKALLSKQPKRVQE